LLTVATETPNNSAASFLHNTAVKAVGSALLLLIVIIKKEVIRVIDINKKKRKKMDNQLTLDMLLVKKQK